MKLKLAVFYFTIFCVTLTAISVGIIEVFPAPLTERVDLSDFSFDPMGLKIEDMCVFGYDDGSKMQFVRYTSLCSDAVFDKTLTELYPKTGHLSCTDEDGNLITFLTDSGYFCKNAYAVFENLTEGCLLTMSVIDDKNGGCLLVLRQTKNGSADSDTFANIIKTVDFAN